MLRFVIRRMTQLQKADLVPAIFSNLELLHPLTPPVIAYLASLQHFPARNRRRIGERIIDAISGSFVGELPYHRMWGLSLFATSDKWQNEHQFLSLLNSSRDEFSRRKLILALGQSRQIHWFQTMRRQIPHESAWPKRALLAAAMCIGRNTYDFWIRPQLRRLDILEHAVVKWAKKVHFGIGSS
jgi:hypothetical protein